MCYIVFVHGNVMTARTSDVITAYCSGVGTDMMVARPSPAHHINRAHVHVHVHVSYRAARLIDRQAACMRTSGQIFLFHSIFIMFDLIACSKSEQCPCTVHTCMISLI